MRTPSIAILAGWLGFLPGVFSADTSSVPRPTFGNVPYGVSVNSCTLPGKAAITFDDGPDSYSSDLLDILAKNGVKATFFVNGDTRSQRKQINDPTSPFPGLLKRMHDEGHQIGSHGWGHLDFTTISKQQRVEELLKLESALVDILGFFPVYFRPPFTSYNGVENELKDWGYHNLNFDLDTEDWREEYDKSRSIVSSGLSRPSFITLLHENHQKSVYELLPFVIDEAKKRGYEFVTVGDCLGDHPNNWYRDPATGGPWGGPPPTKPKAVTSSSTSSSSSSSSSLSSPSLTSSSSSTSSTSKSSPPSSSTPGPTSAINSTTVAPKPATTTFRPTPTTETPTPKPTSSSLATPSQPELFLWTVSMLLGSLVLSVSGFF